MSVIKKFPKTTSFIGLLRQIVVASEFSLLTSKTSDIVDRAQLFSKLQINVRNFLHKK